MDTDMVVEGIGRGNSGNGQIIGAKDDSDNGVSRNRDGRCAIGNTDRCIGYLMAVVGQVRCRRGRGEFAEGECDVLGGTFSVGEDDSDIPISILESSNGDIGNGAGS